LPATNGSIRKLEQTDLLSSIDGAIVVLPFGCCATKTTAQKTLPGWSSRPGHPDWTSGDGQFSLRKRSGRSLASKGVALKKEVWERSEKLAIISN